MATGLTNAATVVFVLPGTLSVQDNSITAHYAGGSYTLRLMDRLLVGECLPWWYDLLDPPFLT